jgi:hypothetical protein
MTEIEKLTRGLITLVIPTLKRVFEEEHLSIQEGVRVIKALETIEKLKVIFNEEDKPKKKWDQTKLDLG